jgi:hypothetical protein
VPLSLMAFSKAFSSLTMEAVVVASGVVSCGVACGGFSGGFLDSSGGLAHPTIKVTSKNSANNMIFNAYFCFNKNHSLSRLVLGFNYLLLTRYTYILSFFLRNDSQVLSDKTDILPDAGKHKFWIIQNRFEKAGNLGLTCYNGFD